MHVMTLWRLSLATVALAIAISLASCGSSAPSIQSSSSPVVTSSPSATQQDGYRSLAETFGLALRSHFTFNDSAFEPQGDVRGNTPPAFTVMITAADAKRRTLSFDVVQTYDWARACDSLVIRNRFPHLQKARVKRDLQVIVFADAASLFKASKPTAGWMTTVDFPTFVRHYKVTGRGPYWLGLDPDGRIDLIAIPFRS